METVTLKRDDLEPVAELLIKKHDDPAFTRAVKLAIDNLAGPVSADPPRKRRTPAKPKLAITWQLQRGVLTISSASTPGMTYTCRGDHCTCKTWPSESNPAGWCWHRAAWHMILTERMSTDPYYFFHPAGQKPNARAYQSTGGVQSRA